MRNAAWLVLFVFVGAQAVAAQESSDSEARSKIVALERVAKLQAWENKDLKMLDELLDANFFYIDPNGRLQTKGQVMAFVLMADTLQFQIEAMVVQLHNDTAIVTGLYQIKGVVRGSPYLSRGRFVDTWLRQDRRWVAIASLTTPER
jgi:ketosteroid isomerase-like protein